jgi:hypothetical protein
MLVGYLAKRAVKIAHLFIGAGETIDKIDEKDRYNDVPRI